MKKKTAISYCALFILFLNPSFSQSIKGFSAAKQEEKKPGTTYALICGISDYNFIPKLQYAANDAKLFAQFLKSEAGGRIPEENIRLLTDSSVTAPNILVRSFGWINSKNPQSGDRIYIYFSGHGDAVSPEESYLLMRDADPAGDKNNYAVSGTIQLFNLKNRIRTLTSRGVEVILIIDACRTNELPGGQEGLNSTAESMIEKKAGELLFLAASPNEFSFEDKRWGNGHGVFTWYLINGLTGLADEDDNGKVTADEIQTYVIANVKKETRALGRVQTPFYCCNTFNQEVLAYARRNSSEVTSAINTLLDNFRNPVLASRGKAMHDDSDSLSMKYYLLMQRAIADKRFISPDSSCADSLYNLIAFSKASDEFKNTARFEYASALIDEAQEAVNAFVNDKIISVEARFDYYTRHSSLLRLAIALIEKQQPEYAEELRLRLLYLEANVVHDERYRVFGDSYGTYVYDATDSVIKKYLVKDFCDTLILKLKKSIAQNYKKAGTYYALSMLYFYMGEYDSSTYFVKTAISIASSWVSPYFILLGNYEKTNDTLNMKSIIQKLLAFPENDKISLLSD